MSFLHLFKNEPELIKYAQRSEKHNHIKKFCSS